MKLKFSIDYRTYWGQKLMVSGSIKELGKWNDDKALEMSLRAGETWEATVEVPDNTTEFEYKYFTLDENHGWKGFEFGANRKQLVPKERFEELVIRDFWRSEWDEQSSLYTSPFQQALLVPGQEAKRPATLDKRKIFYRFRLRAPRVGRNLKVCVVGSTPSLGEWDESKAVVLDNRDYPIWETEVPIKKDELPAQYKYGIYDEDTKKILTWEGGDNRYLPVDDSISSKNLNIRTDEYFNYPLGNWKGTGFAIPVFSIRSQQSTGIGEFTDIKLLVDWAVKTGMKLIQILPINDTTATKTQKDSYPYAAISVFALHPIYLNLQALGALKDKKTQAKFDKLRKELNAKDYVDYGPVVNAKFDYAKLSFEENKAAFLKSKEFKTFFKANEEWLKPYAMFCYFRDKNGTPDFSTWKDHSRVTAKKIDKFTGADQKHYDEIAFHYYLQFHLDKQLKEATEYARTHSVVLKGDIPIGIYRNSVDAWQSPELYNMGSQAGAPPDDFSITGQNWGFPTYNWDEMAKDGYAWWTKRLQKMTDYFDVFRIDHILGFFRIWEIPWDDTEGLMGHFNPSLAVHRNELAQWGVNFDYDRMCKPYIREHMLNELFGDQKEAVKAEYLYEYAHGCYYFKGEFDSQRKVKEHLALKLEADPAGEEHYTWLKHNLNRLLGEVIFFDAPFANGEAFNPRIAFHSTYSFQELDGYTKDRLDELYIHYYYKRHNDFWRDKAMTKLPALKAATNMLICGEDLGMVPECVPGVMNELKILSLAIQRMPNDDREFWHPGDTPYLSVCSTSSHDMSTIREWWQEDTITTQKFYNTILGHHGEAPYFCEPWIAKDIIVQHLHSPSMWAIFPIQDILAMDGGLRRDIPEDERINVPADPEHFWKYRFHMNIEDLINENGFNSMLREIVDQSGRNSPY